MNLKDIVGNLEGTLECLQGLIEQKESEMMSKIGTMTSEQKAQVLPHLSKYNDLKAKAKKEGLNSSDDWENFADNVKSDVIKNHSK